MSEPKGSKARYKTTNWAEYNAALKARGSLTIWLDKGMQWYAPSSGKRGRQHIFSNAAIQFCLCIKCLFGLALRQSLGMVESLLRLAGLDWRVPDYSTVCRRQKTLQVQLPYRASTTALELLVDSTGIQFLGEGECKRKKHGAEYRRQWRKVHLGVDAHTLEIRAIEVTDNSVGDAPMLLELLEQIPPDEPIASVSGDGAPAKPLDGGGNHPPNLDGLPLLGDDFRVGGICGHQLHPAELQPQRFASELPVHHGDHHIPVHRLQCTIHHQQITIEKTSVMHRIAAPQTQEKRRLGVRN